MKCYLINLDRSPDRLAWFHKATEGFDLDIVRIAAVDGTTLAGAELDKWSRREHGSYRLAAEEIGCFLSHRAVWQAVAEAEDDWVFVAEDDVHFGKSAHQFFSNTGWQPADADIVKAETFRTGTAVAMRPTGYAFGHKLRRLRLGHGGTAGYFLRKTAAPRLVTLSDDICDVADDFLFDPEHGVAGEFRRYQIDPAICVQDGLLTDNEHIGLESTLESARQRNSKDDPAGGTPNGLAKLGRAAARPIVQLFRIGLSLSGGAEFKRIPYSEDS